MEISEHISNNARKLYNKSMKHLTTQCKCIVIFVNVLKTVIAKTNKLRQSVKKKRNVHEPMTNYGIPYKYMKIMDNQRSATT